MRFNRIFSWPPLAFLALIVLALPTASFGWGGNTTNNGANTNITALPDQEQQPNCVSDPSGALHLVYHGGVSGTYHIWYKTKPLNGAWSAPVDLGGTNAQNAHIARDGTGNLHVVWQDAVTSGTPPNTTTVNEIFYKMRSAATGNWDVNPTTLSANDKVTSTGPSIAADATGTVHVIWQEGNLAPHTLAYRVFQFGWQPIGLGPGTGDDDVNAACALDSAGTLHAAWQDATTGEIYYANSSDTETWSNPERVDATGDPSIGPDIALDSAKVPHIVWDEGTPTTQTYYSKRAAGVWTAPFLISNTSSTSAQGYQKIHISPDGKIHVTFADVANEILSIREFSGGAWGCVTEVMGQKARNNTMASEPATSKVHLIAQAQPNNGNWDLIEAIDLRGSLTGKVTDSVTNAAIAGVTITYNGCETTTTDATGNYAFPSLNLNNNKIVIASKAGYYSTPNAAVSIAPNVATIKDFVLYKIPATVTTASVKQLPEQTSITLTGKAITEIGNGYFYLEDTTRSSGIRVVLPDTTGLLVGQRISLTGSIATSKPDGVHPSEREVITPVITGNTAGTDLKPIFMNCSAVGGAPLGLQPGVVNGKGANNIGLLIRISGKVTFASGINAWIDDGSRIQDITNRVGVYVVLPTGVTLTTGQKASVTGVVEGSIPVGFTTNRRLVRPRTAADITTY